jgi:hypothetical protein
MKYFCTTTVAVGLVSIFLIGHYTSKAASAPAGQPAMVEINDQTLLTLKTEFNRTSAGNRVILLLSPTCPTCLQGSSAIENVLKNQVTNSVAVFAVWEPMLPTDWSKPGTSVLRRLGDSRVRQFWDPNHIVAIALRQAERAGKPDCCTRNGFLWDVIAAYGPGAQWKEMLPAPILFNGTMVETAPKLAAALATQRQ